MKKFIYLYLFMIIIFLLTNCSTETTGGTIETTNGIIGIISDSLSNNNYGTIVRLIPIDFNPVIEDEYALISDTTDSAGNYAFNNIEKGSYNLEFKSQLTNRKLLLRNIVVDNKKIDLKSKNLKNCGAILIKALLKSFSPEANVFMAGTSYKFKLSEIYYKSNDTIIFIHNLPSDTLPHLTYTFNTKTIPLTEDLHIKPNDTISIEALSFYHEMNIGNSPLNTDSITSLSLNPRKLMYIGTADSGFGIFSKTVWEDAQIGSSTLLSNKINSIFSQLTPSGDSISWIATDSGLIKRYEISKEMHLSGKMLKSKSDKLKLLCGNNSNLYILTDVDIIHYDGNEWRTISLPLANVVPKTIFFSSNNTLWAATNKGCYTNNGNTWEKILDDSDISLIREVNNTVLLCKNDGTILEYKNDLLINTISVPNGQINDIYDWNSEILIGTTTGVYLISKDGIINTEANPGMFALITTTASITSIEEDNHNNIWFGTAGNGIFIFGKNIRLIK